MNQLPNIQIKIIPHSEQRYDTAGDYGDGDNSWWFTISETPDWRHSFLVLIHELAERALLEHHNIPVSVVDEFDMVGEGKDHPDPGTLKSAPYWLEHKLATQIEKKLAKMLGVDWGVYDASFDDLEYKP